MAALFPMAKSRPPAASCTPAPVMDREAKTHESDYGLGGIGSSVNGGREERTS